MRLMTKGRLALTAMIDLALRADRGPVPLAAISHRQQISLSYLEQLFGDLRRCDLVQSTRGPGGGYSLARPAADITAADIVGAVDGFTDAAPASGTDAARSAVPGLWEGLGAAMLAHLRSVSLQSLVREQLERGISLEDVPRKPTPLCPPAVEPQALPPNSVFAFAQAEAFSGIKWP